MNLVSVSLTDEQSKAVQAVSTFGTTAVTETSKLAGYIGKVLGTIPEDAVGLVIGDPLHAVRTVIAARLDDFVTKILRARHVETTQPVSPSLAIPLLRAAYDESRPALQELWAHLIAAAMDPKRTSRVRQSFIETVKRFDPLDALVLQALYENQGQLKPNTREFLANKLSVTPAEIIVSSLNLTEVRCAGRNNHINIESPDFYITTYGRELVRACLD